MTEDTRPVNLDFDLPAQPQSLIKLAALLREDDINLNAVGALIEGDMSFAAAVMKAVNSPLYGLKGRVQSVQQAVTYLGVREISAIAYEAGLQAAFPQVPQLIAIWERASIRGLLMGRLAQALSMEAWSAHTAACSRNAARRCCTGTRPRSTPRCWPRPWRLPSHRTGARRLRLRPRRRRRQPVRGPGA